MATKKKSSKARHRISESDLWGNTVTCPDHWWNTHIIDPVEGHPEMTGREADVAKAIRDPDLVRPSTKTGMAYAFETFTTADTVRVIVYFDDPTLMRTGRTFGNVATAYPDDPAYSSQVGAPIYRKAASQPKKTGSS
jgi:hypothetical protein